MIHHLKSVPLAIMLTLLVLQQCLGLITEPARLLLWYGSQLYLPLIGGLSVIATLWFLIRFNRWRSFRAWATFVTGGLAVAAPFVPMMLNYPYPATVGRAEASLAIRVPLNGPVLVAWGGNSVADNYHAVVPDQRWAHDLVVPPAFTGSMRLGDYGCYGQPILAPVSGVVIQVHDGERDEIPTRTPENVAQVAGNHILIRPSGAEGLLYIAHLKPTSITVRPGEAVREGQVIGACGNSGNSSKPHVHIHYARYVTPPTDEAALSYGLPLYFRGNTGPPFPHGGFSASGQPTGDTITNIGSGSE